MKATWKGTAALLMCLAIGGGCASTGHTANLKPAPDLQLRALVQAPEGAKVDWASLRGQAVVLEFWATWCGPCVAAIPHLNELAEKFADQPVQFIAITDEDESVIRPFLAKKEMKAWVVLDKDRATFDAYGVNGIPHTFLIDRQGRLVADTHPAHLTEKMIEDLLAGRAPPETSPRESRGITPGVASDDDSEEPPLLQVLIRPSGRESGGTTGMSAGSMTAEAMPLRTALSIAYAVRATRIEAAGSLPDKRYNIVVAVPRRAASQFEPLLQQALIAAFDLEVSRATRELDVLVLTAPHGVTAGLQHSVPGAGSSTQTSADRLSAAGVGIDTLAAWLEEAAGRPVFDETGLEGRFDFEIRHDGEDPASLQTAVQKQLALNLIAARRPVEILVVSQKAGGEKRR